MTSIYLGSLTFAFWSFLLLESMRENETLGLFAPWFTAIALAMTLFHALYFTCELKRLRRMEREGYFDHSENCCEDN